MKSTAKILVATFVAFVSFAGLAKASNPVVPEIKTESPEKTNELVIPGQLIGFGYDPQTGKITSVNCVGNQGVCIRIVMINRSQSVVFNNGQTTEAAPNMQIIVNGSAYTGVR